jgi:hypothetical protein
MRQRRAEGKNRWKYDAKAKARATLGVYLRRGKVQKKPCEHPGCGKTTVQAHHPDYSKPLDVVWLCRPHHNALHRAPDFSR